MKFTKKLIKYCIGALIIGGALFVQTPQQSYVQAQDNTTVQSTTTPEKKETTNQGINEEGIYSTVDMILKLIYLLLWPLIFIGGLAMDNTMVYGEFMHMDAVLRKLWNLTKNMANFTLAFLVLREILKNIFQLGENMKNVQKTITNALIAGIGIQASWFIVAAVIDVSTIATYGIGGLPINILRSTNIQNSIADKIVFETHTILNLQKVDGEEDFQIYYKANAIDKDKKKYEIILSPCMTINRYVAGRKIITLPASLTTDGKAQDARDTLFGENKELDICLLSSTQPIVFNRFNQSITDQTTYNNMMKELATNKDLNEYAEACKFLIRVGGTATSITGCTGPTATNNTGVTEFLKTYGPRPQKPTTTDFTIESSHNAIMNNFKKTDKEGKIKINEDISEITTKTNKLIEGSKLSDVITWTKGHVGHLFTMYISLLDFSNLVDTSSNAGIVRNVGEFLIKGLMAVAMAAPLLALAIALLIRIAFLWMVIAASPFIALELAFPKSLKLFSGSKGMFSLEINNIIKTIFMPVITVFALSMGLIFMNLIINTFSRDSFNGGDLFKDGSVKIETNKKNTVISLGGAAVLESEDGGRNRGEVKDPIAWLIVCIIGIGVMRTVVFSALQASGNIGESIGSRIKEFGENIAKTMPVVPIMGGLSIDNLKSMEDMGQDRINKFKASENENIKQVIEYNFPSTKENKGKDETISSLEAQELINKLKSEKNFDVKGFMEKYGFDSKMSVGAFLASEGVQAEIERLPDREKPIVQEAIRTQGDYYEERKEKKEVLESLNLTGKEKTEIETAIKNQNLTVNDYPKNYKVKDNKGETYVLEERNNTIELVKQNN